MKLWPIGVLAIAALSLVSCTTPPPALAPPLGEMPNLRGTWKGTWGATPITLVILEQQESEPAGGGVYLGPWQVLGQSLPGVSGVFSVRLRNEMVSVNVRGRLGNSNGRLTLVLEPVTVNGGWISVVRLDENRLVGTGSAQMSWEPQGPVELTRQPQGPAANRRPGRSAAGAHILPSA